MGIRSQTAPRPLIFIRAVVGKRRAHFGKGDSHAPRRSKIITGM